MNSVFEMELEPKAKIVLLTLADHANADGFCFPGQETLARRSSIPERTLRRILQSLEELNLISRERRCREDGTRKSDGYQLNLPAILAAGQGEPTGQNEGAYRPTVAGTYIRKEPSEEPSDTSPVVPSKKPTRSSSARGTRLPEGWVPPREVEQSIRVECPGLDLEREHRKFSDHWAATPGARGVKLDWVATWRNWMRRAYESMPVSGAQRRIDHNLSVVEQLSVDESPSKPWTPPPSPNKPWGTVRPPKINDPWKGIEQ